MTKYISRAKKKGPEEFRTIGDALSKSRRGGRGKPMADTSPPPQMFKSWAQEVLQVLDKPTVAVCIFIFGVVIIVVASKQLKVTFDILEYYWGGGRPQDGFIGNFMVIFVFMYVWLDTIILQWLKVAATHLHGFAYRRYCQILEALEKIQEQDELEELQRRRMARHMQSRDDDDDDDDDDDR